LCTQTGDSSDSENEGDQAKQKQQQQHLRKKKAGDDNKNNSSGRRVAAGSATGRKIHGRMKDAGETVLYIGHLPCILEEPELKQFIGQFGKVLHLELARSKKTNRSLGYAFCQMQSADVARVVADTLSGYLLMGEKRLVCHVVPPEKVRRSLFVPTHAKKDPHQEYLKMKKEQQAKRHHRPLEKMTAVTSKLVARERKLRQNLKDMGIDYDFPGYEAAVLAAQKKAAAAAPEGEPEPVNKKEQREIHDDAADTKGRKRKDSVGSVDSAGKKERKRKDSVGSVESSGKKERKRSDSIVSIKEKSKKEGKRKDSIGSVEGKSRKDGKRKDSIGSVEQ
jgi:nucleolar protein 15